MSHLKTARSWLQARYRERIQEQNIVSVHTPEGEREPTDEDRFQARVTQQEFHDFLLTVSAPLNETVHECERLDWISTVQQHDVRHGGRAVPVGPRCYLINPKVNAVEGAKVENTSSSTGHTVEREPHEPTDARTDELNVVTIVESVDSGLYGKVYKGVQSPFDRPVAVKIIKDCGVRTADVVAHARLLTRVQHPAVVTVFSVQNVFVPEFDKELPAIIMEWLEGSSFGRRLGGRKFTGDEAICLSNDVLSGIAELHKVGLCHGDLHFGNVIVLNSGHAKIIDIDANKEASLARLSIHSREGAIASDIDYCRGIIFKTLKHSDMSLSQLSDIEPRLHNAASLADLSGVTENLSVDSKLTETAALTIKCEDVTHTAKCSIRIAVEAQKTIDGVGVYVVDCEPEIVGIEDSPLRPMVGINDTHEVSVNAGNPQKFHLLNCPASHATMHLMTVHAGTMRGAGIQFTNTEQRLTLRAVGRDARSEDVTITIHKNGDQISVASGAIT